MPIPSDHLKPIRLTAKESAFSQLQQWIIEGTLQPGEKLNDTELAKALGVSRTPVRESLQLLEVQGLVKMYPGKATQVTEVDRESIKDLLPPLAALQSLSVELAITHLTDEIVTLLEDTNEQFAKAIRSENYYSALKLDEDFHQIIVDTANNSYIQSMLSSLQPHVSRLFFYNSIILTEKSIAEHADIIELMKSGEGAKASSIMKNNWLRAIEEFRTSKT
ncbi:GntR family transcriptional regulator [Lederbergia galactosidilytica]|uniref:GntR family transcriptional regulator n=1 Tax=Lederbergia galactosidilytica TaxID=217031 RepID=A0A178A672_9BACI|nr:GntR family transcriptional regulator [Lederbergia galactosidilytica]KRG16333.1 GntR family transcriptional regulator [Virgibacillus soli]MBP1915092.1 DNA-binding GntR family transcriptional regulator [Lederbergia galactosidilytica]OAK75544.1 GntR family transcriptional regulator [Lederbergia galactosidilytica]